MQFHGLICESRRDDFMRVPGLYRRWEFQYVLQPGADYHIENAGETKDGGALFALYRRDPIKRDVEDMEDN